MANAALSSFIMELLLIPEIFTPTFCFRTRTIFVPAKRKCLATSGMTLTDDKSNNLNALSVMGNFDTGIDSPDEKFKD
jgi:hypothetical protein